MKKKSGKKRERQLYVILKSLPFIILAIVIIIWFLTSGGSRNDQEDTVRTARFTGQFYPATPEKIKELTELFFSNSYSVTDQKPAAIVAPHAGYAYAGQVAAHSYKQIEGYQYTKVFIISQNHNTAIRFSGVALDNHTTYKTVLGTVKISPISKELEQEKGFITEGRAHDLYIIENEIIFLQETLENQPDMEIIPMVFGAADKELIAHIADVLQKYIDDNTLIIISTDLSHFQEYEDAKAMDEQCIANIANLDAQGVSQCDACAKNALDLLVEIGQRNNWNGLALNYKNSQDTMGNTDNGVVGYGAASFYKKNPFKISEVVNEREQKILLALAKKTVEEKIVNNNLPNFQLDAPESNITKDYGCFVTINKNENLRGCVGDILPSDPLYVCVMKNALNAAENDARFPTVSSNELQNLSYEISILTKPVEIPSNDENQILRNLRPEIDGVVLNHNEKISTFLPQVWKQFQTKEDFLRELCKKQGSADDCWKSAKIFTYQVQAFSDKTE